MLLSLLLLCGALAATPVESWTVTEGTDAVLVGDHRAPLIRLVVDFPVGDWSPWASGQPAEEAFEALRFDPDATLRQRLDELAVDLTLEMHAYHTRLAATFLKRDLDEALILLHDLLDNDDLDRAELRRWKQQGGLEWRASLKRPEFRLRQQVRRMYYIEDDPRRRSHEKPETIETRPARLTEVSDKLVRLPGRVIGIAGDVTRDEIAAKLTDWLPETTPRTFEGTAVDLPALIVSPGSPDEDQRISMPRITQTFFAWTRPSLTYDDADYPAFLIADHVLGGHFLSRLYRALRHEGGETYSTGTEGHGGVHRDVYTLWTFTRIDNAPRTERKLREVLTTFHQEGINEKERQAAVGFLRGRRTFAQQSPGQVLDRILWERRHGLVPGFRDALIEQAAELPVDEINRFIRGFFDPARFRMVVVTGPP